MAKKESVVPVEGVVEDVLPSSQFRVNVVLEGGIEKKVLAYLSGKMQKNFIKILPGDKVWVELSIYDLSKGRIVYRETNTSLSGRGRR